MSEANGTLDALREAVATARRVLPRAGGTKPALSTPPEGVTALDVSGLSGIVEYDPEELTVTALAGTPLREIERALAAHDQYMPFDPPWVDAGATLGGAVAAATSGPLSQRHGGVRDFVVGVRFVDGTGTVRNAGGRLVKNAAGFDVPKLMAGSIGRLGVLVQLTFKVFPRPLAWATLRVDAGSLERALDAIGRLATAPFDVEALDLEPSGRVWLRIGGPPAVMATRLERLRRFLGETAEPLAGPEESELWHGARELRWAPAGAAIVKVALHAGRVTALDALLQHDGAARRYSRAANLAWVAWPEGRALDALDETLRRLDLPGLVLTGPPPLDPLIGRPQGGEFARRMRGALDPAERFLEV